MGWGAGPVYQNHYMPQAIKLPRPFIQKENFKKSVFLKIMKASLGLLFVVDVLGGDYKPPTGAVYLSPVSTPYCSPGQMINKVCMHHALTGRVPNDTISHGLPQIPRGPPFNIIIICYSPPLCDLVSWLPPPLRSPTTTSTSPHANSPT